MLGKWQCGLIAAFVVILVSSLPSSFAHPVFTSSSPEPFKSLPASPREVNVFFSESIELDYSKISVLNSAGSRVDINDAHFVQGDTASIGVTLQPNLPEDVYTVTTRVLSAVDGHVVGNTFTFGVGITGPQDSKISNIILSPAESASRFPGMVGQVMVVGAAFATLWLWKPLARVPWLLSAISDKRAAIDRNMMRLVVIGTGLVLASGVAMIVVQSISIEAGISDAIATKFGNVWLTRMLQSSILMVIAVSVYRKIAKSNVSPGSAEMLAILVMGLAVLVTSSLIAHAAATSQTVAIIMDFFHNAAASIWIGGVILLGFAVMPKMLAINDERTKSAAISILIPRFSTIVVTVLGISVITGPLLLSIIENDLSLTVASVYGQILAVKLALAGTMVGLGAYSQFAVQKKAVMVMAGGSTIQTANLRHYAKVLKAEAGVGIALLLMVSLMANGTLPSGQFPSYQRQQAGEQEAFAAEIRTDFVQTIYVSEGRIVLTISPFAVGQNSFRVSFLNSDGSATEIESATLKLTQVEEGIGPIEVETKRQSQGVFTSDAAFSLPGRWIVEIEGSRAQGSNMLSSLSVNVKPLVSNLSFEIKEYRIGQPSLPLYPVFDAQRESIWAGDSLPGSGRIWQLDMQSGNYTVHRIKDANLITQIVLDPASNSLWYIDPTKSILGLYDPATNSSKQYSIPEKGIASGLAEDSGGRLWVPIVQVNKLVRFDPASEEFSSYDIPTPASRPVGIAADRAGNIWFAEAAGNIARVDAKTGQITEFAPKSRLQTLDVPTAVFPDPKSSRIYVSEHDGHTISVFNSLLGTFSEYPVVNEGGLPFGMAMDSFGNLWYAQHQIDRIAVIDPRTGAGAEAKIPTSGSFIQWITSDDRGRIWFAEQRGAAIGSITITAKPPAPGLGGNGGDGEEPSTGPVQELGFSLADVAGPAIAAGIVVSALAYSKSATDLKRNTRTALKLKKD